MRTHRGEVSKKDYSSTEYEFAVCSHGGENSPGIFLRNIYTLCEVTGVSSLTRTVPYGSHIHRVLPRGENLTDQHLSKHYRVKLDLDGLRKARHRRITKTATKQVSVLSLCCEQRQETFVNLGLFQTNTN